MVRRDLKNVLVVSIFVAILVFSFGLYLGYTLDNLRVDDISSAINEVELDSLYYITSQNYLDVFGYEDESSCELMKSMLYGLSPDILDIGRTLTSYESKNIFSGRDYNILKHKYFLLEVRSYTLFTKLKEDCDYDVDLVLFFYDQYDEDSKRQGYVLDNIVNSNDNFYVFSFDRGFDEAIMDFLNKRYNITVAPTIVVNEDIRFEGFTSLNELRNFLKDES